MSKRKVTFMTLLKDYFETYMPYSRGLSPNTINSYKQSFLLLLRFMLEEKGKKADDIRFSDLNYDTLLDFFNWLERDRLCKPTTRNQRLSALSAFSEYAQNRDFDAASVFRSAIIRVPVKKGMQKTRAVFTRQEICDLKVRDLRIDVNSASVILTGKGSKTRQVGIPVKLAGTLQSYIKHKHIESFPNRHIFSSQTHEQMTISCVEGIYKKYVSLAKKNNPELFLADSYPPHSMRHSTACHLLEAGVDIVTIKNILGHVSVQTTQIYAEMSQNTVDQKLREWNETWFGENRKIEIKKSVNIPDFLRKR